MGGILRWVLLQRCQSLVKWTLQWFYWTQELLEQVEQISVRITMVRLELATTGFQTQCSSH